uniref:RNase H family protein n=1 Tax=Solanum tuberosum TaxID=4113 RepID=M1AL57_SOLTU
MAKEEEIEVREFFNNGVWNEGKLKAAISEEMYQHIIENIKLNVQPASIDKAWWTGNTGGSFSVKSAFNILRNKRAEFEWSTRMWSKGLPFKIAFFLWRVWRRRIPTYDNLKRMKMQMVSKCYCCENGELETMSHLLLTAPIAQKLWKQFASCVGICIDGLNLQQLIFKWWEHKASNKLEQIMKAVPTIIIWELWKRRNARRHGKKSSYNWMFYQCQLTIHQLIKVKFMWLRHISHHWTEMVDTLQRYKPTLYYHIVSWRPPEEGWITCNTDGASKGNPGQSAYGFCIRNIEGDLIHAEAESIGLATNMEAEVHAIWKGLQFCLRQVFVQVRLETDSLVLKNMIIRNWRIPWELVEKMEEIQEMIHQMNVQVKHIFREANMLADCIANTAVYTVEKQEFHNFNQLTSMGRRILNIDKQ